MAMRLTWRFKGSYKWGSKSPNLVLSIVTLLVTLLTTTHETPSRSSGNAGLGACCKGLPRPRLRVECFFREFFWAGLNGRQNEVPVI